MGIASPTVLREETTINLHFWHAHCSPTPPTITTTCTIAPRGAAQTHLSNTQDVPPASLLPSCFTPMQILLSGCTTCSDRSQRGTDNCEVLVWRAFSILYMCTVKSSYICMQAQALDIFGRARYKNQAQVGPHTFKHEHNMSLVSKQNSAYSSSAGSLSDLSMGWMEAPHHSWQISTYLYYVCGDERRNMDRFLLPDREFLTSCTAPMFFSSEIWGEGQVKRPFSLG